MSIYGISGSQANHYESIKRTGSTTEQNKKTSEATTQTEEAGVVYEPSDAATSTEAKGTATDYSSIVKQLKGELSTKNQYLQDLVDQLLNKQATKYTKLSQLFNDIKNGKISVDSEDVVQAQKDVAEDGYWGVEQTSDRLVSMAQALSGGDATKADEMISAIKKGYEQATKAWGDELPEICQKTLDAATKKLENWRDGLTGSETED